MFLLAIYIGYRVYIVTNMFLYDPVHGVVVCRVCSSCVVPGESGQKRHLKDLNAGPDSDRIHEKSPNFK